MISTPDRRHRSYTTNTSTSRPRGGSHESRAVDPHVLWEIKGSTGGEFFTHISSADFNQDGVRELILSRWLYPFRGSRDQGRCSALSVAKLSLATDTHQISVSNGGTQKLLVDAGTANKGRNYWVFGSATGTKPGVTLASAAGSVTLPLVPDVYTDFTISLANTALWVKTRGTLDATGKAQASIVLPKVPSALGVVLYHAYLVYDPKANFYMASNPTTLLGVK